MKVGVYLTDIEPTGGGGYTYVREICEALVANVSETTHEFVFITTSAQTNPVTTPGRSSTIGTHYLPKKGFWTFLHRILVKVAMKSGSGKIIRWIFLESPLDQLSREIGLEFLIFFSPHHSSITDTPYLVIVWDVQHRLQPWWPEVSEKGIWELRERSHNALLRRASVLATGTEAGRTEIHDFFQIPVDRIRLLPQPTPSFVLEPSPSNNDCVSPTVESIAGRFLFYPAQFWAHKNHVNLLLAMERLVFHHSLDLHLVCVGSDQGNMRFVRTFTNSLGLNDVVHFLGFVPRAELVWLYRNAFALSFVTFFGPDNLPPLEAFALGCPVVASNVPGAAEQLGEAALLVDPKDPAAIADAVQSLWNDPNLRQRLVERGLERATKNITADFVRRLFSILDDFEPVRRCWGVYSKNSARLC